MNATSTAPSAVSTSAVATNDITDIIAIIVAARHGKVPTAPGVADKDHQLGDLGKAQAAALKNELAGLELHFDLTVSSPLHCAMSTSFIATDDYGVEAFASLGVPENPHHPLNVMFEQLGSNTLITDYPDDPKKQGYFQHKLGGNLKDWARAALADIILAAKEEQENKAGKKVNIFIGGHAVCQNALIWAIGESLAATTGSAGFDIDLVTMTPLGEAHAFMLDLTGEKPVCTLIAPQIPVPPKLA